MSTLRSSREAERDGDNRLSLFYTKIICRCRLYVCSPARNHKGCIYTKWGLFDNAELLYPVVVKFGDVSETLIVKSDSVRAD
jgi:hypothetical protein